MTREEQERYAADGYRYYLILKELDEWLKHQYNSNNKYWAREVGMEMTRLLMAQGIDLE